MSNLTIVSKFYKFDNHSGLFFSNSEVSNVIKVFTRKGQRSLQVHEGIKPFKCEISLPAFHKKGIWSAKCNVVHEKKKPYSCQYYWEKVIEMKDNFD